MKKREVPNIVVSDGRRKPRNDTSVEVLTDETTEVQKGVSLPFIERAFKMGRATVNRRLAKCKPIGIGLHGTPMYDLAEAASYLIEPKMDIAEYLTRVGPAKLPEKSREAYWSSKLKEQRYRAQAGELWDTESVISSVGELFKQLRQRMQLLPVDIASQLGLENDQKKEIIVIVDSLQADMAELVMKFGNEETLVNQLTQEENDEEDEAE